MSRGMLEENELDLSATSVSRLGDTKSFADDGVKYPYRNFTNPDTLGTAVMEGTGDEVQPATGTKPQTIAAGENNPAIPSPPQTPITTSTTVPTTTLPQKERGSYKKWLYIGGAVVAGLIIWKKTKK